MTGHPVWDLIVAPSRRGSPHRQLRRASGHRLTFADGTEVLDATSGLWNANLGYGNPAIAAAVHAALLDASYLTLFRYSHDYAVAAAEALIGATGRGHYDRVLFSTSGSAANDAVMKFTRQHAILRGEPERNIVVGLHGSYHGQTYGAAALSGDDLGQSMYGVDARLVRHVDHRDVDGLTALLQEIGSRVCAVVVEPVLGSGAYPVPAEFLAALFALRREHGFLLVCDEVATGFGRTGPLFASALWPERPDLLVTSKALTNGTCGAAAVLFSGAVCAEFDRTDAVFVHGETQAGTPPTCAAIVATLQQFDELQAIATGRRNGSLLAEGLSGIARDSPLVIDVTGAGCFYGLRLRDDDGAELTSAGVATVIDAIRAHGVLVHPGPGGIQVVPALTYSAAEIDTLLEAVAAGLADHAASGARPVAAGR